MDYKDNSDFEINKAVAETLGLEAQVQSEGPPGYETYFLICWHPGLAPFKRDYCNNPSDAWPIIESIWDDLMLTDVNHNTEWDLGMKTDDRSDKLRAAMIVFLKMQ